MKIATWNVNSMNVRQAHVIEWLQAQQPDVLVLQEIKQVTEKFPCRRPQRAGLSLDCQRTEDLQRCRRHQQDPADRIPSRIFRTSMIRSAVFSPAPSAMSALSISTCPMARQSAPRSTSTSSRWLASLQDFLQAELHAARKCCRARRFQYRSGG